MGWSDYTLLKLLERFVEEKGMTDELIEFLQKIANEEQEASENED